MAVTRWGLVYVHTCAMPQSEPARRPLAARPPSEARALAPAYDYIRALITRWEAEDRERQSRREDESAQRQ